MGLLEPQHIILILIFLLSIVICPVWGYKAGSKRTIGSTGGLLLSLFLGVFGIIIVYLTKRIDEQQFYNLNNQFNNQSGADELKKYKQLLDDGAITEAEYRTQKAKIFNGRF
jgi:hypothetical protein